MKKIYTLKAPTLGSFLLLILLTISGYSQVGINTVNPKDGSLLDITAVDKGVFLPRVNIANLNNIAPITGVTGAANLAAAFGLLVYNTNTTTGPGYFYWTGAQWANVANSGNDDWKITGNANIGAANFLGTTVDQNLRFRTNNIERFNVTSGTAITGGRLQANNIGTSALPTYSWTADPDTGLYRIGDNILGLSTNSVERMRFSTTEAVFNELGNNYDFRLETVNRTNMFFVDASTNRIGIQTTNPAFTFQAVNSGNIGATSVGNFENSGTDGVALSAQNTNLTANGFNAFEGVTRYNSTDFSPAGVFGLAIANNGAAVGVRGIANSSDGLGVFGTIPTNGTWLGYGGLFLGGLGYGNGLYNLSDERAKKNIKTINSALDNIMNINGVSYNYDMKKFNNSASEDTHTYYGFLAQNVKEFLPNAVAQKSVPFQNQQSEVNSKQNNKKQLLNVVDYTAIIPVLVEAMKEQQAQIKALQNEINILKSKN